MDPDKMRDLCQSAVTLGCVLGLFAAYWRPDLLQETPRFLLHIIWQGLLLGHSPAYGTNRSGGLSGYYDQRYKGSVHLPQCA